MERYIVGINISLYALFFFLFLQLQQFRIVGSFDRCRTGVAIHTSPVSKSRGQPATSVGHDILFSFAFHCRMTFLWVQMLKPGGVGL